MPDVITVRIPNDLALRLEPLKGLVNISEVCRNALEAKAHVHEQIQAALSEEDVMKGLAQRLRIQKAEANDWSHRSGEEDGRIWAIKQATYQELDRWGPVGKTLLRPPRNWWEAENLIYQEDPDGNPFVEDMFPSGTAQECLDARRESAQDEKQVFEYEAYRSGFLDAVREVWRQVKGELDE